MIDLRNVFSRGRVEGARWRKKEYFLWIARTIGGEYRGKEKARFERGIDFGTGCFYQ